MPRFKSNNFYQNNPEIKLILQKKKQNFQALGVSPPSPRASGGWQASPQDLQWSLAAGAPPPHPQNSPSHCEFLATGLFLITRLMFYVCCYYFQVLDN